MLNLAFAINCILTWMISFTLFIKLLKLICPKVYEKVWKPEIEKVKRKELEKLRRRKSTQT